MTVTQQEAKQARWSQLPLACVSVFLLCLLLFICLGWLQNALLFLIFSGV